MAKKNRILWICLLPLLLIAGALGFQSVAPWIDTNGYLQLNINNSTADAYVYFGDENNDQGQWVRFNTTTNEFEFV